MILTDQIPDEAVEFIARALCVAEGHDPERLRLNGSSKLWTNWADEARAVLVATIDAWPNSGEAELLRWRLSRFVPPSAAGR